jgi:hypothetical protein
LDLLLNKTIINDFQFDNSQQIEKYLRGFGPGANLRAKSNSKPKGFDPTSEIDFKVIVPLCHQRS